MPIALDLPIFTDMSTVAIINGYSKKGGRLAEALRNSKIAIDTWTSEYAGHSVELARRAARSKYSTILSVGGDGTVNEVVNGIMLAKEDDPVIDPALCIVPAGTANDLANTIGAHQDIDKIEKVLESGKLQRIDVGLVTLKNGAKRHFLNIASMGLGARVVERMHNSNLHLGADLSFLWSVTRTFLNYKRTSVKCLIDEKPFNGEVLAIAVANGKRFGSGIYIAPHAELDDGRFEVVILGRISILDYVSNIGRLKKGIRVEHPEVKYLTGRSIEIEPTHGTTMLETDGELVGELPCKIEIAPAAINLLVWPGSNHSSTGQQRPKVH